MKPPPPALPLGRKLLYLAFLIAVLVAVGELVWRICAHRRLERHLKETEEANRFFVADPILRFRLRPGDWTSKSQAGDSCRFHVNAFGLRGAEIDEQKPPRTIRILCLGGSTTFGTSCPEDSLSYPSELERTLNRRGGEVRWQVLNAGVPRYLSLDSLHNLGRLVVLEPDLVLVLHALNDITFAEELGDWYYAPEDAPRPLHREQRYRLDARSFMLEALLRRFTHENRRHIDPNRRSISPKTVEGFQAHLWSIVELAREHGARVGLVTFATRLSKAATQEEREAMEAHELFACCRLPYGVLLAELASFNRAIRAVGEATGATVLELEGRIPVDDRLWGDPFHLNAEGTRLMVRLLEEQLRPMLRELVSAE